MEKRDRHNLNLSGRTQPLHSKGSSEKRVIKQMSLIPDWKERIGLAAEKTAIKFNNLLTHINVDTLREAYHALNPNKAVGIDGVSKREYGENLEANLLELETRIHKGSYRPKEKRQVLIPKADGRKRPIAISCVEDKLVEWVIGKILENVYEPIFIRNSFGFRPHKSAHQAIKACYSTLKDNRRRHVVEIDFANFFDSIPQRKLLKVIRKRIVDKRFNRLIVKFLKVGILDPQGITYEPESGTPQGSIMSPILANVYLHEVLDTWFIQNYGSYNNIIVRYADDGVFFFKREETAEEFVKALYERVQRYGLSLNEEKTRIVNFTRGEHNSFDFLGFTIYWDCNRNTSKLRIKTCKKTLHKKIQEFDKWIKEIRNRVKTKEIWKLARVKLIGHYQYYGFWSNRPKLCHFYYEAMKSVFKWLNRRSQKISFTLEEFHRKLKVDPLPEPPDILKLKCIGWSPYVTY